MKELSDRELLEAYTERRSEEAFRELVARHVDVVYSAALRQLRNPHLAEEAVQAAFIAFAGKASHLPRETVIAGWLHRAVHFAALNLRRAESRRRHWEEEAATMNNTEEGGTVFREQVLPHVDGALAELSDEDRDALVLRFLQQRSLREVAQVLGTSEEAAKKRVHRALDRLRGLLGRHGVAVPVALLAAGLSELPLNSAPATLTSAVASMAGPGVGVVATGTAAPAAPAGASLLAMVPVKIAVVVLLALVAGGVALLRPKSANGDSSFTTGSRPLSMKIHISSVLVDDQDKALKFYTEILGFERRRDLPLGAHRWLTVGPPKGRGDIELLLEPNALPDARTYQEAIFKQGIPLTSLAALDVRREYERLKGLGVVFTQAPTAAGETVIAVFEDTCGNRIQLHQVPPPPAAGVDGPPIWIQLNSVLVDDQAKARTFYTEVLGFQVKLDLPVGEHRWLTVVDPEDPDGMQLVLEPNVNPAVRAYQAALFRQGIPLTSLSVADVQAKHDELVSKGVVFSMEPTRMGPTMLATFEDTCGNRIQLVQP